MTEINTEKPRISFTIEQRLDYAKLMAFESQKKPLN